MEVGATQVPVNPKSTAAELAGFVDQVDADAGRDRRRSGPAPGRVGGARGPRRPLTPPSPTVGARRTSTTTTMAVMIPTSGTTGRSKLVMQTHRAYVMAGEGFPWWLELTADDRLMTPLPLFHINAPAYSTLGSVAARASPRPAPGVLRQRLPGRRPPLRGHRVQLHRGHAGDPAAPARAGRRRRHAAAPLLHGPLAQRRSATSRPRRASACASPAATPSPSRPTARSGATAPGPTAPSARSASTRRSAT